MEVGLAKRYFFFGRVNAGNHGIRAPRHERNFRDLLRDVRQSSTTHRCTRGPKAHNCDHLTASTQTSPQLPDRSVLLFASVPE